MVSILTTINSRNPDRCLVKGAGAWGSVTLCLVARLTQLSVVVELRSESRAGEFIPYCCPGQAPEFPEV